MPKTISVQISDELHLQWQLALQQIAFVLGVHQVTAAVVLRDAITKIIGVETSPFDAGWAEGYRAGYSLVQCTIRDALHKLTENPTTELVTRLGHPGPGHEERHG